MLKKPSATLMRQTSIESSENVPTADKNEEEKSAENFDKHKELIDSNRPVCLQN